MAGDPKVVAALALAILAMPPVVNAIMAKAVDQADTDWLRDLDPQGEPREPPENFRWNGPPPEVPPGEGEGEGEFQQPPPPPPCRPVPRDPQSVQLGGPAGVSGTSGALEVEVLPGDVAVVWQVQGRGVTGNPRFQLLEGGTVQFETSQFRVNEDLQLPGPEPGIFELPDPGVAWTLSYDVANVAHQGIRLDLAAMQCAGVPA